MKLIFKKNDDGKISVEVKDKEFTTKTYIEMIKKIKNEEDIEVEFSGNIDHEEEKKIKSMVEAINGIREEGNKADAEEDNEDSLEDDLPF